ncbi:MAG: ketoacyl-ACP synthase III [Myxococcota bacterium]
MRVVGLSACVPKNVVTASVAYERFPKAEVDRIIANIGVKQHREIDEATTGGDLAVIAAAKLLEALQWPKESVDALVYITLSPDHLAPGSSTKLAQDLGLRNSLLAFDMTLGCSGYTHGLLICEALLQAGLVKRVLMLCGEGSTGRFRPGVRSCTTSANLGNALLFGDAGSCTALEAGPTEIRAKTFGADGTGYENIIIPAFGARLPGRADHFEYKPDPKGDLRREADLVLNGAEIFTFSIRRVPPMFDEMAKLSGWGPDDVDYYVFHQANKFMLDFLRKKLKLPETKVPISIDEFGNTSSVSIPLTMVVRCQEALQKKTKWMLLGFGLGFSWSSVALESQGILTLPLIEV